ncbi:histone-lysine N-methyltransferase SETMAR [Trichonephila clavipes]|nr:histone-lysine N-methyltransferase SETMAR [Trichonephila clavipes]
MFFTERNPCRRVDVCALLLKRHEKDPFLKCMITGDEKWVVSNNVKRKRSWSKRDKLAQYISIANIYEKRCCNLFSGIAKESSAGSTIRCLRRAPRDPDKLDLTKFSGYKVQSSSATGASRFSVPRSRNQLKSALRELIFLIFYRTIQRLISRCTVISWTN